MAGGPGGHRVRPRPPAAPRRGHLAAEGGRDARRLCAADRLLEHVPEPALRHRAGRLLGEPQPDWELAAGQLGHVVACHPEAFADKSRFSMDWYYPVLGGPVRGGAAQRRLAAGWDTFVVPGLGVRCVSDQPWVTGAETCELAIALDAIGDRQRALELFAQIQHLRDPGGAYWTGWQFVNQAHFPDERSSWTSAAVVLAADALSVPPRLGHLPDSSAGGAVHAGRWRGVRLRAAGRISRCRSADAGPGPLQHP